MYTMCVLTCTFADLQQMLYYDVLMACARSSAATVSATVVMFLSFPRFRSRYNIACGRTAQVHRDDNSIFTKRNAHEPCRYDMRKLTGGGQYYNRQ